MLVSPSSNDGTPFTLTISPRRTLALVALLALASLGAGCADKPKESGESIAWSEPGTPAAAGSVSPGAPVPAGAPPMAGGPPLDWRTGIAGDIVTVEVHDRNDFYRVDRVELVGPNSLTVAAYEINRSTNRGSGDYGGGGGGPSVGVGVGSWSGSGWNGGRSSGTGVGLGLGFPLGGGSSSSRNAAANYGTNTSARMKIPDMAFYRQTAATWVVRVHFSDRNNQPSSAVVPAPKPAA